jgi:hypothetical protein
LALVASNNQDENGICALLQRHEISNKIAGKCIFCELPERHISLITDMLKLLVLNKINNSAIKKVKLANLLNRKTLVDCWDAFFSNPTRNVDIIQRNSVAM